MVERNSRASTSATTLRGRWLIIARVAWVAVAVFTAGVFVVGIPGEFARLQTPCTGGLSCVWVPRLSAHNAQQLSELGLATDLFAAYFVAVEVAFMAVSFAIGAAIFWRRSDDRMALLVSLTLIGGVAATQAIFRALTDQEQQPQLAIVVSTLVIAALFMPLRRRIIRREEDS